MTDHGQPLILVCNDDGIDAPGIASLVRALTGLGEIHVVAPVEEQSAVGHSISVRDPVRAHPWVLRGPEGPVAAHAVTGTPADCVKLAIDKLLPRKPDLVVSGINQGPNTSVNVIYSGTVSAATEATILGIDSIAVSYCSWKGGDFGPSGRYARQIAETVLANGLPEGVLLNVNVPDLPFERIRGITITRQAKARWEESFHERRDPMDRPYYWLTGKFINLDDGEHSDLGAVEEGYVSVTPVHYDMTAYASIDALRNWEWKNNQ